MYSLRRVQYPCVFFQVGMANRARLYLGWWEETWAVGCMASAWTWGCLLALQRETQSVTVQIQQSRQCKRWRVKASITVSAAQQ